MEFELVAGCVKGVLDKYGDSLIKKFTEVVKDEWEKFKVDFDLVFLKYLNNSFQKYSKIKTILYKTEPKSIYDFFECPTLLKGDKQLKGDNIDEILTISRCIILQGAGGIGKSTLMRYLFLESVVQHTFIPIFIELKDINNVNGDYDICDFIFERLDNLGSTIDKKYLDYALNAGCFTFFLDGYDEIIVEKRDEFFRKFNSFCDKYSENNYLISSRPYSEFVEFQRFTVLDVDKLSKEQAISLITKIDYEETTKNRFIEELDKKLYESHESFASNPLLLNIMLLTFDNYAEIPQKLHLFYEQAFETLYYKHDANKGSYKRELKTNLTHDTFRKTFSMFCFISYSQGKVEFSFEELKTFIAKTKVQDNGCEIEDFIYDLVNSICVLQKDGINYRFTHRSFQEYFTALFLKELSDEKMKLLGINLIKGNYLSGSQDNVFKMLYDMSEMRMEQNILFPLIEELEKDCHCDNKYDFYFSQLQISFVIRPMPSDYSMLYITRPVNNKVLDFIYFFSSVYWDRSFDEQRKTATKKLFPILKEHKNYSEGQILETSALTDCDEAYKVFKDTWAGAKIEILANLKDNLIRKQKKNELDLSELLE